MNYSKYVFSSHFAKHIEGMIQQKKALGFPYHTSIRYLCEFDDMCKNEFPNETSLTKEIGQKWGTIRETEIKRVSFQNRLAPIRELARYMIRMGVPAYIIEPLAIPESVKRPIPHIFTEQELTTFFAAADNIEYNRKGRFRHIIIPVIFRLMYCCGLRPKEARLIKKSDVDFSAKTVHIPESKGHKDRMIVMSDDVCALVEKYMSVIPHRFSENEYLFPNWKGKDYLSSNWLVKMFRLCWETSGIKDFSGERPRPYDFRHTFATKRLYSWMKEGKDLDAYLPYLSTYMGHAHFEHTAYYIHLVPEFFPQMSQMDLTRFEGLLPEVTE